MSHVGLMALVEVVMLLLTLFLVARYAAPRAALAVSSALALSESTVMLRVEIAPTVLEVLGQVSFFLLAAGLAGTVGGYLRSLDSRRLRSVHEARKAQRLQLAADLHDFVAHDVSGILVLAQAAQIVAGPGDGPLLPLLQRIEAAGQQALASLDRTVLMLGDSAPAAGSLPADGEGRDRARKSETRPAPYGLADIPALLERFRCSGRTEVALDFPRADEVTAEVPREVAATAHRAVVEALTNVRRHAGHATAVRVSVRSEAPSGESERMLVVSVRNTAPAIDRASAPFTEGRRGGGTGLAGLQERIAALSGILTAGPHGDGGWEVRARLPYPVAASKN
ncbi:hypothetical protein AMK26_16090 [Streptomyces sp. CB03234]|nr:hypothetical protein AMK26_16090 [Streptomyces sp. CB03234]